MKMNRLTVPINFILGYQTYRIYFILVLSFVNIVAFFLGFILVTLICSHYFFFLHVFMYIGFSCKTKRFFSYLTTDSGSLTSNILQSRPQKFQVFGYAVGSYCV